MHVSYNKQHFNIFNKAPLIGISWGQLFPLWDSSRAILPMFLTHFFQFRFTSTVYRCSCLVFLLAWGLLYMKTRTDDDSKQENNKQGGRFNE
jgi:hypothetical protein